MERVQARVAALKATSAWALVEAHVEGAVAAWIRDVNLDVDGFILSTTGRPATAIAVDRGCYEPGYARCRCHQYRRGKWVPACHPAINRDDG